MVTLIWYPKCSTCKKAKNWLDEHKIIYMERHIVEEHPTKEELTSWYQNNSYELKKFFNTRGNLYKEMGLKNRILGMTEEQQLDLLSTNGMLIRRPLIISGQEILIGFKEKEWEKSLKL